MAFLVECKRTKGFTTRDIENKHGLRSSNTAEIFLEDCEVPDPAVPKVRFASGVLSASGENCVFL